MKLRLIALLLVISVIFSLSSCGRTKTAEKTRVDHVFKATAIDTDGFNITSVCASDGKAFAFGSAPDGGTHGICVAVDTNLASEQIEFQLKPGDRIESSTATTDGVLLMIVQNDQTIKLDRFRDGVLATLEPDLTARLGYYSGFVRPTVDADGNIFFASGDTLTAFDSGLKELFKIEIDGAFHRAGVIGGRVFAVFTDDSEHRLRSCFIDTSGKRLGDEIEFPEGVRPNLDQFYSAPGYDLYERDDTSICGVDLTEQTLTKLVDFVNSGFVPDDVRELAMIDAESAVFLAAADSGNSLFMMKKLHEDEIPEKYVINVAYRAGINLERAAVNFNRESRSYQIRLVDYNTFATDGDRLGEDRLEKELLTDSAPDIIALDCFPNRSGSWTAQGAFADLNEFLDSDPTFERPDYFKSLLDAVHDGKIYRLITNFSLQTIVVSAEYAPDSWDTAGFLEFAKNLPAGKYIAGGLGRDGLLNLALGPTLGGCVDFKTGRCDFDTETFRELLECVKGTPKKFSYRNTLSGDDLADYSADPQKPYRDGKIVINDELGGIERFSDFIQCANFYGGFGKSRFIGFPSDTGGAAYILPEMSFAINKKSLVKNGAWEFLKALLEYSGELAAGGFPAKIDDFKKMCEKNVGDWNFVTSKGVKFIGRDMTYAEAEKTLADFQKKKNRPAENGVLAQTTPEYVDLLIELVDDAVCVSSDLYRIISMINEEAQMYFEDEKSLDETVKIIQDRVSTYMSERY